VHPAGRLGKKLPAREDEKKEENKTNKTRNSRVRRTRRTSTPQPKRLGEHQLHSLSGWEKQHPTPWNKPRGKQKIPPGKGGEQTPLPGEQQTSKVVIRTVALERVSLLLFFYLVTFPTYILTPLH